ncbi:MAG: S9 family peptidase [Desulfurococcales archaeon]|nr:S9 family peptidase [Desulfurococcales archaeon]
MGYKVEKVKFPCGGEYCSGLLYLPSGDGPFPGVVMAGGLGIVKEIHADDYAGYWASRGVAVLSFDYRRLGESEGEPRLAIYPEDQLADYRCAIRYMRGREEVDGDRICLWGTSFSGAHVLSLLLFPPRGVRCGVAQVPIVYMHKTLEMHHGSISPLLWLAEEAREECCRGEYGKAVIPIASQNPPGLITSGEAVEYYMEQASRYKTMENKVTIDSLDRIIGYNPGYQAELVSKPILFIVAERDKTVPTGDVIEVASKVKVDKRLVRYMAGHYDVYKDPLKIDVAKLELEWYKIHLEES